MLPCSMLYWLAVSGEAVVLLGLILENNLLQVRNASIQFILPLYYLHGDNSTGVTLCSTSVSSPCSNALQ